MRVLVVLEVDLSLGNGNVWCVMPINVGLPVPDATGVLNPAMDVMLAVLVAGRVPMVMVLLPPGAPLVPCVGGKFPPTARMPGIGFSWLHASLPFPVRVLDSHCQVPLLTITRVAAWLHPRPILVPSLGPSQTSLVNALALLSNVLAPAEVDRLKKSLDPPQCGAQIADLWKRIWPPPRVSPRVQSVDEEKFSAKEDQESRDDPTRGLAAGSR